MATAVTGAVAPLENPEIVSEVLNKAIVPLFLTNFIGLDVSIILPIAPLLEPVISSPLIKFPVTVPNVNSGVEASVSVASESSTATNLNESALPKDKVLSVGLVPYAPVTAPATLTCFISFAVFVFAVAELFNSVAVIFNFAPLPNTALFVIVTVPVPPPENPVEALTTSPC